MARDIQTAGACPKCGAAGVSCRYNYFTKDDLTIDAWEHKCANCGVRETIAYRSDDPEEDRPEAPDICPYCARKGNR